MRKRSKSTVRASEQARQDIADTFRRYGPLTIDSLTERSGYSRSHAVQVLRQLCKAELAYVVDTKRNAGSGRPLRIHAKEVLRELEAVLRVVVSGESFEPDDELDDMLAEDR